MIWPPSQRSHQNFPCGYISACAVKSSWNKHEQLFDRVWFMKKAIFSIFLMHYFPNETLKNRSLWEFRGRRGSWDQNHHWKLGQQTPSVGTLLAYRDYGLNHILFRNKTFLFFKKERWNFQHLFEMEFCETSQIFSSFRQLLF